MLYTVNGYRFQSRSLARIDWATATTEIYGRLQYKYYVYRYEGNLNGIDNAVVLSIGVNLVQLGLL